MSNRSPHSVCLEEQTKILEKRATLREMEVSVESIFVLEVVHLCMCISVCHGTAIAFIDPSVCVRL